MTPREYLDVAREQWRLVVAGLLLGLLLAGAVTSLMPRQYAADTTVIVATQPAPDVSRSSNDEEISSQRISTYAELLASRRLAEDVVAELGLATTPEELAGRITVGTTPDSVLLTATVTDSSSEEAVRIANAVAGQFILNVAEIEQPADPTRPPLIAAKVFQPADPPARLIAPRPLLYFACGAVLGLILGAAAALLRNSLDARIKTRRQLEQILGAPLLGTIGRDPKIPTSPLVMYGAPHTPLAEAFRQLRTNVSFVDVDREHKVVLVTSATPGEGRSTTVCNLGLAMAEAGSRVLIVDADLRDPSVGRILRVNDAVGLTDVLVNRVPAKRALQPVGPTLDVLTSGAQPPNPSELLGSSRMVNLLALLREMYDVVLIDSAPLLPVTDAAVLAPRVDGVLVVVHHGRTVVPDVQAAKDALDAVSGRVLGSVMTMVAHTGARPHGWTKARTGRRLPGQALADAVVPQVPPGAVPQQVARPAFDDPDPPTVMLVAPKPGMQQASAQVSRSAPPQAHRPATQDVADVRQAAPHDTADVPQPAPQDFADVPRSAAPDAADPAPQDAADDPHPTLRDVALVPPPGEQETVTVSQEGHNGVERPAARGSSEKPAPRPRPRPSDANGQVLDRDGSAAR